MNTTMNLESLIYSLVVTVETGCPDFEIRDYARTQISEHYGEKTLDLLTAILSEKDEDKYMALAKKVKKLKTIPANIADEGEDPKDVMTVIDGIHMKKVIRFPIRGIMQMYHSGNEFLVQKSKEYIVRNYSKYIFEIIHKSYPTYADKYGDELYQSGVMGLLKAMPNYDPNKSQFITFCKMYVIHEISQQLNFYRNDSSTYFNGIQRLIRDAIEEIKASGNEPTTARIAIKTDLKPDIVQRELDYIETTKFRYLDSEEEREQACEYEETPEYIISKKTGMEQLFKSIQELAKEDPNYRDVILMKYDGGLTNDEIAKRLGLTIGQVKAYYSKGITKLRHNPKLSSLYGEYLSDAKREMQKYIMPKFDSKETVEDTAKSLENIMDLTATFGTGTVSETVAMC